MDRNEALKWDKIYLKQSPEERMRMVKEEENFKKEQGINLVPIQQRDHLLAGQKHKPGERKGRGKKKHLSKKVNKRRKEKKKAEKEEKEFYNRMRKPVSVTNSPVLSIGSEGMLGKEKSCAQILEDGQGYTASSYAKWKKCDNEAKEREKLIGENEKRRAESKYTQRQKIRTKKTRRNVKKNKKEFAQQQILAGGKRKRKTKKKRKRKTKRRR